MKNNTDYLICAIIFVVTAYLFYKTRDNYKKLISGKETYAVSERSFFIKGALFTILPMVMFKSALQSAEATIIFSVIFLLGLWNLLHAFLFMKYSRKKK